MRTQLVAWITTAAATTAGIGVFMKLYGAKIIKGLKIAHHALALLDDINDAIQPDADGKITITPEEVAIFERQIQALKDDFGTIKPQGNGGVVSNPAGTGGTISKPGGTK